MSLQVNITKDCNCNTPDIIDLCLRDLNQNGTEND